MAQAGYIDTNYNAPNRPQLQFDATPIILNTLGQIASSAINTYSNEKTRKADIANRQAADKAVTTAFHTARDNNIGDPIKAATAFETAIAPMLDGLTEGINPNYAYDASKHYSLQLNNSAFKARDDLAKNEQVVKGLTYLEAAYNTGGSFDSAVQYLYNDLPTTDGLAGAAKSIITSTSLKAVSTINNVDSGAYSYKDLNTLQKRELEVLKVKLGDSTAYTPKSNPEVFAIYEKADAVFNDAFRAKATEIQEVNKSIFLNYLNDPMGVASKENLTTVIDNVAKGDAATVATLTNQFNEAYNLQKVMKDLTPTAVVPVGANDVKGFTEAWTPRVTDAVLKSFKENDVATLSKIVNSQQPSYLDEAKKAIKTSWNSLAVQDPKVANSQIQGTITRVKSLTHKDGASKQAALALYGADTLKEIILTDAFVALGVKPTAQEAGYTNMPYSTAIGIAKNIQTSYETKDTLQLTNAQQKSLYTKASLLDAKDQADFILMTKTLTSQYGTNADETIDTLYNVYKDSNSIKVDGLKVKDNSGTTWLNGVVSEEILREDITKEINKTYPGVDTDDVTPTIDSYGNLVLTSKLYGSAYTPSVDFRAILKSNDSPERIRQYRSEHQIKVQAEIIQSDLVDFLARTVKNSQASTISNAINKEIDNASTQLFGEVATPYHEVLRHEDTKNKVVDHFNNTNDTFSTSYNKFKGANTTTLREYLKKTLETEQGGN